MTSKQYAPVVLLAVLLHYTAWLTHELKLAGFMMWGAILAGFLLLGIMIVSNKD